MAEDPTEVTVMSSLKARIGLTLETIRAHPTGGVALKVFVAVFGALVVGVGIVLIPLPGPGWLIVIGGLTIWAVEFHWARRLLQFTRDRLRLWTQWIGMQSWPVRLLIGGVGLAFVAGVAVLTLKYSTGLDVVGNVWQYITTH